MMPATVGLIAAAALMLMNSHNFVDYKSIVISVTAFVLAYFFKIGIIKIIFLAGIFGYILF
jgi:chromate transporter